MARSATRPMPLRVVVAPGEQARRASASTARWCGSWRGARRRAASRSMFGRRRCRSRSSRAARSRRRRARPAARWARPPGGSGSGGHHGVDVAPVVADHAVEALRSMAASLARTGWQHPRGPGGGRPCRSRAVIGEGRACAGACGCGSDCDVRAPCPLARRSSRCSSRCRSGVGARGGRGRAPQRHRRRPACRSAAALPT